VTISWAIWSGPTWVEAQAEGARLFQTKHPNVTVETVGFKSQDENITKWVGGSGPHVAMAWETTLIDTGRQGMYLPLDPYIKRDAKAVPVQDYVEFQLKAHQWQGVGQFALPMYIASQALWYNKTLFQTKGVALPDDTWDWTKYQDALVKLTARDQGVWGGFEPSAWEVGTMKILANGGQVVDPNDDRKAAFTSGPALDALQWVHDRLWRDRTMILGADARTAGHKDGFAMLAAGKAATWEQLSWAPGDFARDYPDGVKDVDFALVPKAKQRTTFASIDAWAIWKGAPEVEAAWELMKFLQTPEWLDLQARMAGIQHPRISMQDQYVEVMKKGIPALSGKNLQAFTHPVRNRYARPGPIFRQQKDSWQAFTDAWNATMRRNEQPVADAFRDAARRIEGLS
jgi:multiple sugar transport system substrate-binding protein